MQSPTSLGHRSERFVAQDFNPTLVEVKSDFVSELTEVITVNEFNRIRVIILLESLGILDSRIGDQPVVTTIPRFGPSNSKVVITE